MTTYYDAKHLNNNMDKCKILMKCSTNVNNTIQTFHKEQITFLSFQQEPTD